MHNSIDMDKKTLRLIDSLEGWLSVNEGLFLRKAASMVKGLPGHIVEIGSFQGKSTIYLASTGQTVYAVDPHKGEIDDVKVPPTLKAFRDNIKKFGVAARIRLLRMTSKAASRKWKGSIKLLFIDGLHDEKNAEHDFRVWSPYVKSGGIIAMHDSFCGWRGAERAAIRHIVHNDSFSEIGVVGSIIYGIRGKGSALDRLLKWRSRVCIKSALWLHHHPVLPGSISFFLIHRLIKLLLLNRFTLRRD